MKFSIRLNILLVFIAVLFAACEKDNMDEIVIDEPDYQPEVNETNPLFLAMSANNPEGLELGCISILYPFDMALESGSTITINSEGEFTAAIDTIAMDPAVDFIYPLDILNGEGETAQVNSIEELGLSFVACVPVDGWDYVNTTGNLIPAFEFSGLCFDLVYPVNLTDAEGNLSEAADESELIDLIVNAEFGLFFVFPISVVDEAGEVSTIEHMDDFYNIASDCDNIDPVVVGEGFEAQGFLCYQLVYPIEVLDGNGNLLIVNDANEYANLVLNGEALAIQYSFTLESIADQSTYTVNDFNDYIAALNECEGVDIVIDTTSTACDAPGNVLLFLNQGGPAQSPCRFSINYPVDLEAGGTTFTINTYLEYFDVYNAYNLNEIEVVYPVTVTVNSTGEVLEFTSDDDLCTYIEDCN